MRGVWGIGSRVTAAAGLLRMIQPRLSPPTPWAAIQMLPARSRVIDGTRYPEPGMSNSVIEPAGVIRPILLCAGSANQTFPSPPRATLPRPSAQVKQPGTFASGGLGTGYSTTPPALRALARGGVGVLWDDAVGNGLQARQTKRHTTRPRRTFVLTQVEPANYARRTRVSACRLGRSRPLC